MERSPSSSTPLDLVPTFFIPTFYDTFAKLDAEARRSPTTSIQCGVTPAPTYTSTVAVTEGEADR
jgi:hypothetical protein